MKQLIALKKAFTYSIYGMASLFKERAFQHELILGILLLITEILRSLYFVSTDKRLHIFTAYVIVLISETLNTAIEATVDRIGKETHPLSKTAKDIGSAAVFIALVHLGIIWILSWFS
ncbi:MAG: diacylglycerol kinase [Alphaproteobacteria bacterium]|nr:diacylglycerol kinase [Alphaproteobacteria bacterium]